MDAAIGTLRATMAKKRSKGVMIVGLVLTVGGGVLAVVGIVMGVSSIGALYSQALDDPMATRGVDVDPKAAGSVALRWAIVGGVGAIASVIGSFMTGLTVIAWIRRKLAGADGAGERP
jgi:hypothetical protein